MRDLIHDMIDEMKRPAPLLALAVFIVNLLVWAETIAALRP